MKAGAAICPKCDHILDASFLSGGSSESGSSSGARGGRPRSGKARSSSARGSDEPAASADSTQVKPVEEVSRPGPSRTGPARPTSRPASARPAARARPAPQEEEPEEPPQQQEEDWRPKRSPEPQKSAAPASRAGNEDSSPIDDPRALVGEVGNFFSQLGLADRLAFVGLGLLVLSCLLPWMETDEEGSVLGVLSSGAVALMGAGVGLGALVIRVRKVMPQLGAFLPWMVQMGASVFCVVWCIVFMKEANQSIEEATPMGTNVTPLSSPSLGVYLGLLAALVASTGSLMGIRGGRSK